MRRDVRVKITNAAGVTGIGTQTILVGEAPPMPPAFPELELPDVVAVGEPAFIRPRAASGTSLSFDLDGDGEFDETPAPVSGGYQWTFTRPVTIAVKATDATGEAAVRTADVTPWPRPVPQASLMFAPERLAGRPLEVLYSLRGVAGPCCGIAWDADGDGAYDDGAGAFPAFAPPAGPRSVGLRVLGDGGAFSSVRTAFTVGTQPPRPTLTVDGSTLTAKATDPEGDAITAFEWDLDGDREFDDAKAATAVAPASGRLIGVKVTDAGGDIGITYAPAKALGLSARVRALRLATLRSRGLSVTVRCVTRCDKTVTASVGKSTAKRLGLRSREIGRAAARGSAVRVRLNSRARRAIRRARSLRLRVAVNALAADGRAAASTKKLTVRR